MEMSEHIRHRYAERAKTLEDAPDGTPPTLGVGDPVELAGLRSGETVVDLGSGPGRDLFAAATSVGRAGRAIGVDMTPEMIERARTAARERGLNNVAVLDGELQRLPFPCASVDVVISNCVINLVGDKRRALAEAYRVLAPGGRLAIVDTAFDTEPPPEVRADPEAWSCCVGGALTAANYEQTLRAIGFEDIRLAHLDASCGEVCAPDEPVQVRSVGVRARKPGDPPTGPRVRPAIPADRARIQALVSGEGLPLDGLRTEDTLVLLDGQRIVGVVALERYERAAVLRSLAVDPAHRRAGHGRRLVIAALETARWSGVEEVFLFTEAADAYFANFGFAAVSRERAVAVAASAELSAPCCEHATTMRLNFEEADLPLLGRPSRKPLPTFENGACC